MKTLITTPVVNDLKDADASFVEATLVRIRTLLAKYIPAEGLQTINEALAAQNRRQLSMDDLAMIAYVHAKSIRENEGASPYKRIKLYCAKHGKDFDNVHVRVATNTLLTIEFMKLVDGETEKGKCRSYSITKDVWDAITND